MPVAIKAKPQALLFEAALNVDVRQLSDEVAPVLLLAVIGVIVCTFVVGLALWPISSVGILACVILGAIIATTDPVAVVGIFHDIGAPRRLSTLVQGESLFNDAAAIAIYSIATSSHADAPRGMEFLYSPNRLNVAISRAKCVSILVGSPRIFEAECRTPRQMQLANAFCRFLEMAVHLGEAQK